jgi:hypothetical protein
LFTFSSNLIGAELVVFPNLAGCSNQNGEKRQTPKQSLENEPWKIECPSGHNEII